MAKIVVGDEYDEWLDRAMDEVGDRLAQVRELTRQEFAISAPAIISEINRELVELALRAQALNSKSRSQASG